MKLVCSSGEIEADVGGTFRDKDQEWEIVAFAGSSYSPSALGGTPNVRCRPVQPITMSDWWRKYIEDDGCVVWCGDSVAAQMLARSDGKPRSSRGDLLRT